jgi:hypothetical protein
MASNNEAVDSVAISNVTNENTNNSVPSRDDQEPRGEAIVGDLQRRRPLSKMMRQGYILSPEKQSTSPLQNNYQTEMCFGFSLMPSRSARFAKSDWKGSRGHLFFKTPDMWVKVAKFPRIP